MRSSLKDPKHVVKEFLAIHWDGTSPLLIAYSGGFDSKTLLYTACAWKRAELHVAHVDHGWREESAAEALTLASEVESLGLKFHTIRLQEKMSEEGARLKRQEFYRSLNEKIPYQAVLLAHQADDLAETVLKRIFEGASLTSLGAMKPVSTFEGIELWRPLLGVRRASIEQFLQEEGIVPLEDPSNEDFRYLRARMRQSMIPAFEKQFGKQFARNLTCLSERSHELERYFSKKIEGLWHRAVFGPFGWSLDLRGLEKIEARELVQRLTKQEGCPLTRDLMERILDWVSENLADLEASIAHRRLIIDRGRLFLLSRELPRFGQRLQLSDERQRSGAWSFEIVNMGEVRGSWEDLWQGSMCIPCPEGEVNVDLPFHGLFRGGKGPAFLRKICPALLREGGPSEQILGKKKQATGRMVKILIDPQPFSTEGDRMRSWEELFEDARTI